MTSPNKSYTVGVQKIESTVNI